MEQSLTSFRLIQLADYAHPETRQHFISECSFLDNERAAYSEKLLKNPVFQSSYTDRSLVKNPEFLTQLTLDTSAVLDKEQFDDITWVVA